MESVHIVDVFLIAPKGSGHTVRSQFLEGKFAKDWLLENQAGRTYFNAKKQIESEHEIEKVGAELRGLMSWMKKHTQNAVKYFVDYYSTFGYNEKRNSIV